MSVLKLLDSVYKTGNGDLFVVSIDDITISFKLPSSKKAVQLARLLSFAENDTQQYIIYNSIFKSYVTSDFDAQDNQNLPAGLVKVIAELILIFSGVTEDSIDTLNDSLNIYREQVNSSDSVIKRVICSVFPGYTFKSLDDLSYQELLYVFTNAEAVLLEREMLQEPIKFSPRQDFSVDDMIKNEINKINNS